MTNETQEKAVVFAGDYAYIRQIETALKSLCYHNSHLKIYVFNQDIPTEWFRAMREYVERLGSSLIDIKLMGPEFAMNWSNKLDHINHMTFARYFIPDFVAESTVLYLDSDLVVTGSILPLFELDLTGYYAAVAESCFGFGHGFNAGVMVINNALWKAENLRQTLVETTEREHENVNEGDQSILNMVFAGRYVWLDEDYNFQIGFDRGAAEWSHREVFEKPLDPLPTIIHYISPDKPWNQFSNVRLRDVWWHYNLMEWTAILDKWQKAGVHEPVKQAKPRLTCFNMTHSYLVEQAEYLIKNLPDVHFIIAAYTFMATELLTLTRYPNVTLSPNTYPLLIEDMLDSVDVYLDINHFDKIELVYSYVNERQIPKLAFDNTQAPNQSYVGVYNHENPQEMVAALCRLMDEAQGDEA